MSKKTLLMGSMIIILIAMIYCLYQRILFGQLICLAATTGLFILTNKKHIQR